MSRPTLDDFFEDTIMPVGEVGPDDFFTSSTTDFILVESSISENVRFGVAVYKPRKPSPILLVSHGWHMSIRKPEMNEPSPFPDFLVFQVDMRGRHYSTGKPDCNGLELYDFYDVYRYACFNYTEYISAPGKVYFYGSSGGGGNALAMAGKFPDLLASFIAFSPVSD